VRILPLSIVTLFFAATALANEIREFDLKTIERLGNELTRVSQQPDHGATNAARRQAIETAKAALQGRLYNIHYDYVVLDDPDGSGFLVYALGRTNNPNDIVLAGHFRVTVSPDGKKAERVDALSRSLAINKKNEGLPSGYHQEGMVLAQIVSSKPVETLLYTSNVTKMKIAVATPPNGQVWFIENGKIRKSEKKK
jgi:hypothetical protein